ncbi:MAG: FtsX-like permease family protein [Cyclobacteriaceae bacterium]
MKKSPPGWLVSFLRWFCNADYLEEIEGDLHEIFNEKVDARGLQFARKTFVFDVLKFFRWSNFKSPKIMKYTFNNGLWKHNLLITFRVFKKNMLFTGINISGLVLGICSFTILFLYYIQENSYDKVFPENDRIFRVAINSIDDGHYLEPAKAPIPLYDVLNETLQGGTLTRMMPWPGYVQSEINTKFKENQFVFADESIFDLFPFESLDGSVVQALEAPMQIVLTQQKAVQYFGDKSPIGKTITFEDENGKFEFAVTAVIKDLPENTHFHMDFIASFSSLTQVIPWYGNWFYPNAFLYAKLGSTQNVENTQKLAEELLLENGHKEYLKGNPKLVFQKLTSIHLTSDRQGEWKSNNTQISMQFFLALGAFILLIAIINYVNLTTANSQQRSREIGIKKAMGSEKSQLIKQFFMESLVTVSIAIVLSVIVMVTLWHSLISQLLNGAVAYNILTSYQSLLSIIIGVIALSAIAGTYPTLATVRFNPIDVLKNNLSKYLNNGNQRKILVTVQFSISMCLILLTILLVKQYNYMQDKNMGFKKDYQIGLKMVDNHDKTNYKTLKDELKKLPFIENVAVSNTVLGAGEGFYSFPVKFPDHPDNIETEWYALGADEDYLETFDIELLEGRNFNTEIATDQRLAFIVNEAAANFLNLENGVIGQSMEVTIYTGRADIRKGKVIGVVKDFNFQSLYESVKPLVIYINKHPYYTDFLNIKLKTSQSILTQIKSIEKSYSTFNPNKPMEFMFVDDEIKKTYQRELASSKIMTTFTILSILIAALGVFGLATYTFRRRAKEIGIRKVMGASSSHITMVLTKEYVYIILISCIISWPVVYILSSKWLDNFAYSIEFGPLNYLLGLVLVVGIAFGSSLFQILKSLKVNPVEHLRDE